LLDDVEGESFKGEGVLKGNIRGELVLEQNFAIDGNFNFSRDEGEVKDDGVVFVLQRDIPSESLLAALHMLPHLLDFKSQGLYLLHFK
jgi:hypothetical protein